MKDLAGPLPYAYASKYMPPILNTLGGLSSVALIGKLVLTKCQVLAVQNCGYPAAEFLANSFVEVSKESLTLAATGCFLVAIIGRLTLFSPNSSFQEAKEIVDAMKDRKVLFGVQALSAHLSVAGTSIVGGKYNENIGAYAAEVGVVPALDLLHQKYPDQLSARRLEGLTIAHTAAYMEQVEVLDWIKNNLEENLIKAGDNRGVTPAHEAVLGTPGGSLPTLNWMLEHLGEDFLKTPDHSRQTTAHYAAGRGQIEVLKWMREHLGDDFLMIRDNSFQTIAHKAARKGKLDTLQWIEANLGADFIRRRDQMNRSIVEEVSLYQETRDEIYNWMFFKLGRDFIVVAEEICWGNTRGDWDMGWLRGRLRESEPPDNYNSRSTEEAQEQHFGYYRW